MLFTSFCLFGNVHTGVSFLGHRRRREEWVRPPLAKTLRCRTNEHEVHGVIAAVAHLRAHPTRFPIPPFLSGRLSKLWAAPSPQPEVLTSPLKQPALHLRSFALNHTIPFYNIQAISFHRTTFLLTLLT